MPRHLTVGFGIRGDDVGPLDEEPVHRHFQRVNIHIVTQSIAQVATRRALLPVVGVENHVFVGKVAALAGEEFGEHQMTFVTVAVLENLEVFDEAWESLIFLIGFIFFRLG